MQLEQLLLDATGCDSATSKRAQYIELASLLRKHGHPVSHRTAEKWFERGSLPGGWLMKITAMSAKEGRPIDLHNYA